MYTQTNVNGLLLGSHPLYMRQFPESCQTKLSINNCKYMQNLQIDLLSGKLSHTRYVCPYFLEGAFHRYVLAQFYLGFKLLYFVGYGYGYVMGAGLCSSRARWPLVPKFCSWATRKTQIFHTNHMLGTLGFTVSEHWAPFNFPQSTALGCGKSNMGLVYCGNIWLQVNELPRQNKPILQLHSRYCCNTCHRSWQDYMLC